MILALAQRSTRLIPSLFPLEYMVEEAIDFLREYEPEEGYFVGFSGGKDSIVTLELCRMAGVKHHAAYHITTIDPPELVRFIRKHYPLVEFQRPKFPFWDGVRRKGPPKIKTRWCCEVYKESPGKRHPLGKQTVLGIRAEESKGRAERGRVKTEGKRKPRYYYHPIFHWAEWHVWEFINYYNLPYPSLYDLEGYNRAGCVICPYIMHKNSVKVKKAMEMWPGMFRAFERAVSDWFRYKRKEIEKFKGETLESYLEAYYRGFE